MGERGKESKWQKDGTLRTSILPRTTDESMRAVVEIMANVCAQMHKQARNMVEEINAWKEGFNESLGGELIAEIKCGNQLETSTLLYMSSRIFILFSGIDKITCKDQSCNVRDV